MALEGYELGISKDALFAIAKQAVKRGTGARALRSILEKLMLDLMYDLPDSKGAGKITINRAVVEGKKAPAIRKSSSKDAA